MKKKYKLKNEVKYKFINFFLNIAIIFFGIILLFTMYNFIQTTFLGKDYADFFGYSIFEVKTGSMGDAISVGDWIIVKQKNDYQLDDIVTFNDEGNFITHRIIEKYNDNYVTKGDANSDDDDPITDKQIVGEVVNVVPMFGVIKSTIFNPIILFLIIITFYILTVVIKGEEQIMLDKIKNLFNKIFTKSNEAKMLAKFGDDLFTDDDVDFKNDSIRTKEYIEKEEDYSKLNFLDEIEDAEDNLNPDDFIRPVKTDEQIDEDLSKTTFFRIITVDEEHEEDEISEIEEELDTEDFKDKDEEDVHEEETHEETPENLLEDSVEEEVEEKEKTLEEDVEEKIELEALFASPEHKKAKGVIAKLMSVKTEEINKVIDVLFQETRIKPNENVIRKELIKSYIESKYYNIFSKSVALLDRSTSTSKFKFVTDNKTDVINEKNGFTKSIKDRAKKTINRIGYALEEDSNALSKKHSGSDKQYSNKLEKYAMLLMLIAKLEYLETTTKDLKGKKTLYAREIIKYTSEYEVEIDNIDLVCKKIIDIQKKHNKLTKYFLERLKTEVFDLGYSKLKSDKNKYIVKIKHNINFSKVYSSDVIDNAYEKGIVAEDKLKVLLTLLQARLGKDMLKGDFTNEYLVLLANTLCDKEKKLERFFKDNDDEYAKRNIIYLIEYDHFMKNAKLIKTLRKNGYRIAIYIDTMTRTTSKNKLSLALAEYIFIDKQVKNVEIEKVLIDNFKNKIIKDDLEKFLKAEGDRK